MDNFQFTLAVKLKNDWDISIYISIARLLEKKNIPQSEAKCSKKILATAALSSPSVEVHLD